VDFITPAVKKSGIDIQIAGNLGNWLARLIRESDRLQLKLKAIFSIGSMRHDRHPRKLYSTLISGVHFFGGSPDFIFVLLFVHSKPVVDDLFKGNIVKIVTSNKKGFIFDLFHTLTARESTWSSGINTSDILGVNKEEWNKQLLEKSKDRLTGKEKNPFFFVRQMARAINPQIPDELIERAVKFRIERMKKAITTIPDANLLTLKTLKNQGMKLGLLSNADFSEIEGWKESPLAHFFDSTVFSCEAGFVKPEPQIYQISLQQLALSPRDCVFVGDGGSYELEGAKSLGMTAVFIAGVIRELWPDKIEGRMKIADYTIEELVELVS